MGQTVVQKILAKASGREKVEVGEIVEPKVSLAMSHENGALVINQFNEICIFHTSFFILQRLLYYKNKLNDFLLKD